MKFHRSDSYDLMRYSKLARAAGDVVGANHLVYCASLNDAREEITEEEYTRASMAALPYCNVSIFTT